MTPSRLGRARRGDGPGLEPRWRPGAALAWVLLVALLGASLAAWAGTPSFPALSGRVVDAAGIIPADTRASVEQQLKTLEDKSGIQFVVATVPSLEGLDIETYANELFRSWKLGQKDKNNGVLLLVAPKERQVRIEVGYGLEGTLTDALTKLIIFNSIAPRFKAGDYGGGIARGVQDVITTLSGDAGDWAQPPKLRAQDQQSAFDVVLPFLVIALILFIFIAIRRNSHHPGGGFFIPIGGPSWGGSSWGGSSWTSRSDDIGGGFSGGGGSSGGGGASGGW
jgi:uncharacterized protein